MVPIQYYGGEGGHATESLRSPILLSGIIIVAALSAFVFCGFNGITAVNGEVAGIYDTGVVASFVKENALIVPAVLFALSSALVLRGIFKGESSRR